MARKALALALLVAACAATPPEPEAPQAAGPDTCGRDLRSTLVGQQATALERVLILGPVRIIRPGDPVTEDFSPRRINFDVDARERIGRVWCG